MGKLNNNQKAFCREYVKNGNNGTKAYMKAYKTNEENARRRASELVANSDVLEYIKELQDKLEEKDIMSAKERMKWLTEVVNNIQREEANVKMPDGETIELGSKNADLQIKMKAIDILNKMSGEYTTKIEGNIGLSYEDVLKEVESDEEY
jgi:phage terminase small subunit